MIKIACIGAPSTGKSTTAAELKKIVEKRNVVEYISAGQFLKSCGYGINEDGS
jgi:tRNA uridine 5-carbamoylmethylation protein Kti12